MDGNFRPKLTSFGLNKGLERLERQPLYPAADLTARSWFVLFCQVAPKYRNTNIEKYRNATIPNYKNTEIHRNKSSELVHLILSVQNSSCQRERSNGRKGVRWTNICAIKCFRH